MRDNEKQVHKKCKNFGVRIQANFEVILLGNGGGKSVCKWRNRTRRELFWSEASSWDSRSGARDKIPVFGILKLGDKVYTQIVKNCSMSELIPIIKGKTDENSVIHTDGFKTYNELADYGYKKHYRVKHADNEFANGHNHINGIENFWGAM